jgi:hypothetical protein
MHLWFVINSATWFASFLVPLSFLIDSATLLVGDHGRPSRRKHSGGAARGWWCGGSLYFNVEAEPVEELQSGG